MTADLDDSALTRLALELGQALAGADATLTTAESCTGGWIAKCLTDVPGSSAWFGYSLVTYSNAMKSHLLGVDPDQLEQHGAVSEAVVRAMALGALRAGDADLSAAVSGVAGPDGGTESKPVGLVWFAWAGPNGILASESMHFPGDRERVRRATVRHALEGVLRFCEPLT
jgi:nicotinamide-nucleotide amidase